jgi:hypothetical protein
MKTKSLYNPNDLREILARIEKISVDSPRQWGKMDAAQMLRHCYLGMQSALGEITVKRVFISYLVGPLAKKYFLTGKPFQKNSPTGKELVVVTSEDLEIEKKKLIEKCQQFHTLGKAGATKIPHGFFGKLTADEWASLQYTHLDHHLRQFSN